MTSTRYGVVTELLRQAIVVGATGPVGALPTEAELCAQYRTSRTTLRHALVKLRDEGLLLSRQGSGWSVAPRHRVQTAARYRVRSSAAPSRGRGRGSSPSVPTSEVLTHHRRRPPGDVAAALKAKRTTALLLVERVTRVEGAVIHRAEVWFNRPLSTELDVNEAREQPPARLLAARGQAFGRFDQYVEAVAANRRDQALLGVQAGTPVLQVVRTAFDPQGTPLFRSQHRHPGHNTEIELWLPITNVTGGPHVTIEG